MSAIPFTCACGTAVPSHDAWRTWAFAGFSCFAADKHGPEEHWETRNCPACKSTRMIRVQPGHTGRCKVTEGAKP